MYLMNMSSTKKYPSPASYDNFNLKYSMSFQDGYDFCTNVYRICMELTESKVLINSSDHHKSSLCHIYPGQYLAERGPNLLRNGKLKSNIIL